MVSPPSLFRLVYQSESGTELSAEALASLLHQARTNNLTANLTGMLLYANGRFMQVLEGKKEQVARVYQYIQADARHHHVQTLSYEPVPERAFPDWRMAFASTPAELPEIGTGYLALHSAPGLVARPPQALWRQMRAFVQPAHSH